MEVRRMNMKMSSHKTVGTTTVQQRHTAEYDNQSSSNSNNFRGKKMTIVSKTKSRSSYFSMESMVVLVGLTVSLLILPLVLPPLPPPPLMLLLLPIFILVVLMVCAFMPSASTGRHKAIA